MSSSFRLLRRAGLLGLLLGLSAALPAAVTVEIRDAKGAPVADAVASLIPLVYAPPIRPPAEPVVIGQEGEEFRPYVTVVPTGTRVSFPNRDRVQHHVYSLSKAKSFELPLYRGESREPILFDQPGVVTLGCNIHDWMVAYVVVVATPYFGRSDAKGTVAIERVIPGRYRLEVWHPRATAPFSREVTVGAGAETQPVALTLRPDRRIRRAPEAGKAGSYE